MRQFYLATVSYLVIVSGCGGSNGPESLHDMAVLVSDMSFPAPNDLSEPMHNWMGTVSAPISVDGGIELARIAKAKLCIVNHPELPCATTDDSGNYSINAPVGLKLPLEVQVSAAGYVGLTELLYYDTFCCVWDSGVTLFPDGTWPGGWTTQPEFSAPANGKAFIDLSIATIPAKPISGATVTLSPSSGIGPVYLGPQDLIDPTLTALTSAGRVFFGEVNPGNFEIAINAPGRTCFADSNGGWPTSKANTIAGVAVADSVTQLSVECN